jgi:uridylate kinase
MKEIKRVILKLSGEALAGKNKSGYDDELIAEVSERYRRLIKLWKSRQ